MCETIYLKNISIIVRVVHHVFKNGINRLNYTHLSIFVIASFYTMRNNNDNNLASREYPCVKYGILSKYLRCAHVRRWFVNRKYVHCAIWRVFAKAGRFYAYFPLVASVFLHSECSHWTNKRIYIIRGCFIDTCIKIRRTGWAFRPPVWRVYFMISYNLWFIHDNIRALTKRTGFQLIR